MLTAGGVSYTYDNSGNQTGRGSDTFGWDHESRRYYEWDHTHNDIEVYDKNGRHLGSIDPVTGEQTKPPNPEYKIDVK